jgi:hypothetical protein
MFGDRPKNSLTKDKTTLLTLHAQVYPVQVVPQLLPPYTLNFSDYYQGTPGAA